MSSTPTVLVTGSNKGIGKGLLSLYLARPSTTAIALVRDPSHPTSQTLHSLPKGKDSKLIVLQYDASIPESAQSAIATLQPTTSPNSISSLPTPASLAATALRR